MIEQALLFAEDRFVLELADNYGGWDYDSIKAGLDAEKDDKPYLAGFIFIIYLYKYLGSVDTPIQGFGHDWLLIEDSDLLSDGDRNLLIYGHPLATFIQDYQIKETLFGKYLLKEIHPFSTGGRAGYLSPTDVNRLYENIQKSVPGQSSTDMNTQSPIVKAKVMLEMAIKAETGLCLIISG